VKACRSKDGRRVRDVRPEMLGEAPEELVRPLALLAARDRPQRAVRAALNRSIAFPGRHQSKKADRSACCSVRRGLAT
jgi:hypothetical protein